MSWRREAMTLIRPSAGEGAFSRKRERGQVPLPLAGEVADSRRMRDAQLCTPLTYQSITARSLSFIRSPLATRSLPDWSAIGPVKTS